MGWVWYQFWDAISKWVGSFGSKKHQHDKTRHETRIVIPTNNRLIWLKIIVKETQILGSFKMPTNPSNCLLMLRTRIVGISRHFVHNKGNCRSNTMCCIYQTSNCTCIFKLYNCSFKIFEQLNARNHIGCSPL